MENEVIRLFIDEGSASIAAELESGVVWHSNPPDREEDSVAKGIFKMELSSQITISYLDSLRNRVGLANSFAGSVRKSTYSISKSASAIRVTYTFASIQISIPVEYRIGPDYLEASVIVDEITEEERYRILTVGLLPFFGAGGLSDTGYLVVPDGSGALISFNNNKSNYDEYEAPIYGRNPTMSSYRITDYTESIRLPVFGIRNGENGLLAVVTEGDVAGSIQARVSGKNTSYNRVFNYFTLRTTDAYIIGNPIGRVSAISSRDIKLYEKGRPHPSRCSVRYYFLETENATYIEMAHRFRRHLSDAAGRRYNTTNESRPLYIELYGAVRRREPVLGLPVNVFKRLTTTDDVRAITEALESAGVSHSIITYDNWSRDSVRGKRPMHANVPGRLGGRKGFDRLLSELAQKDVILYPRVDFINIENPGNGFTPISDAAKFISGAVARQKHFAVSTQNRDPDTDSWFLLSPKDIDATARSFLNAYGDFNHKFLSVDSLSELVYSDFSYDDGAREDCLNIVLAVVAELVENGFSLSAGESNAYLIPYIDHAVGVPTGSSGYDLTDWSIPFYQAVLRGYVNFSGPPVNLSPNPRTEFLHAMETGSSISFAWVYRNAIELRDTTLEHLYSADFSLWLDIAAEWYQELDRAQHAIGAGDIASHELLTPEIRQTGFVGGASVLVNYGDRSAKVEGIMVPAEGYALFTPDGRIIKGGGL
jgi:hypothetical protein